MVCLHYGKSIREMPFALTQSKAIPRTTLNPDNCSQAFLLTLKLDVGQMVTCS